MGLESRGKERDEEEEEKGMKRGLEKESRCAVYTHQCHTKNVTTIH